MMSRPLQSLAEIRETVSKTSPDIIALALHGLMAYAIELEDRKAALEAALSGVSDLLSMAAHDAESNEEKSWAAHLLEIARRIDVVTMPSAPQPEGERNARMVLLKYSFLPHIGGVKLQTINEELDKGFRIQELRLTTNGSLMIVLDANGLQEQP